MVVALIGPMKFGYSPEGNGKQVIPPKIILIAQFKLDNHADQNHTVLYHKMGYLLVNILYASNIFPLSKIANFL